jgi:hypothetical protein
MGMTELAQRVDPADGKPGALAVTDAMVRAAEKTYAESESSLGWFFGSSRMRSALESALAEVDHARSPELDAAMVKTLDTVARYFVDQGQGNVAEMLRLIRNRISTGVAA